jgi:hypothetical protein
LAEVRHHRFWSLGRKKRRQIMTTDESMCCDIILCGVGIQLDVRQVLRTQLDSRYVFSGGFLEQLTIDNSIKWGLLVFKHV